LKPTDPLRSDLLPLSQIMTLNLIFNQYIGVIIAFFTFIASVHHARTDSAYAINIL